ncbi:DUF1566 domain-containing protein [Candidatus Magnetobacterium casense]|uniref:DUF1566 domain-containing protein n=1 Tax=Candidatus Magnetobacterium casense TaxID=1455061 RepID=A0ABS6RYB1_9BACT|nr:DUF1566 domain-containing protein [Candidatus Magnetobacterium casensis]MBV6341629.1 DUF1566 domain-containing protein [Candidatus Magnetobacterium casensis]
MEDEKRNDNIGFAGIEKRISEQLKGDDCTSQNDYEDKQLEKTNKHEEHKSEEHREYEQENRQQENNIDQGNDKNTNKHNDDTDIKNVSKLGFGWGNFWIISGFVFGGLAFFVFFIGGVQTSVIPNRGVALIVSILKIAYSYGIWKRKKYGLYLTYVYLTLVSLSGVVSMAVTGGPENIAKDMFAIGLSILWFVYFQNRKDWFNDDKKEKQKTKKEKSQGQDSVTDDFKVVALVILKLFIIIGVTVSLIFQGKSELSTPSNKTQSPTYPPPPPPIESETQNKNIGCIEGNCVNGYGTYSYSNGDKYVGEWKDRKHHGQGTYTLPDGTKYEGQWKDDKVNGQGTLTLSNGDKYVGQWKDDKRHGKGTYTFSDGRVLSGIWSDGELIKTPTPSPVETTAQRKGIGCITGTCFYGYGTFSYSNGDKYVGQWKDYKHHGKGIYTFSDGSVLSGIWSNGKLVTEIKTPTTKPVESIPPITDNIKKDEHNYRFKDNGNGTLTDSKTGLIWTKNAKLIGRKDWKEALNYITSMNEGKGAFGYTDWRLPDRDELESLVKGINVPYVWLNSQGFTNVQSGYYWSSTACAYVTDSAWLLSMDDGNVFAGDKSNGHYYVWPVRAAQ